MTLKAEEKFSSQRGKFIEILIFIVAIIVVIVILATADLRLKLETIDSVLVYVVVFATAKAGVSFALSVLFADANGDDFVLRVNRLFDDHPRNVKDFHDAILSRHDHKIIHQQNPNDGSTTDLKNWVRGGGRKVFLRY